MVIKDPTHYTLNALLPTLLNVCSRNRRAQELHEQTVMQDSNCDAMSKTVVYDVSNI